MGRSWQITCYKKGFKTPGWLVGGIMYQIFPDRFYFSGEEKNIKRTDFKRNKDWYALPEWKPDENGMIKNNDFFMGDLKGITMKLDYLESLGVSCIYLNPISEAYSNHRYDTGDYSKVDPILGTEEDFKHLCAEAKKRGIHIINDGVFSHTGSDSVYFNRFGRYGKGGAYNDKTHRISVGTNSTNGRTITKAGGALILCPRLLRKLRHSTNISTAKTALSENG